MASNSYKWLLIVPLVFIAMVALNGCKEKASREHSAHEEHKDVYTCSMHPQIIRDKSGKCPICGMALIKKSVGNEKHIISVDLNTLLQPTNTFVVSSIPVTTVQKENIPIDIEALGSRDLREYVIIGAAKRLRPKLMTVSVSLFGLIPILWATGVGSDVMRPITIPLIGGTITSTIYVLFITPVVFEIVKERELKRKGKIEVIDTHE